LTQSETPEVIEDAEIVEVPPPAAPSIGLRQDGDAWLALRGGEFLSRGTREEAIATLAQAADCFGIYWRTATAPPPPLPDDVWWTWSAADHCWWESPRVRRYLCWQLPRFLRGAYRPIG
jgi:hypothetical protein